jgi:putative holliday junction resolvase
VGTFVLKLMYRGMKMRILGLDVGEKTIGVAVSDPLGFTAQGIDTIRRKKLEYDINEIMNYCKQYEVDTIVVGLPKNMNGTLGPQGEKMLEFSEVLRSQSGLKIEMWDERLTTVAANRAMLEADISRAKRKKIVDKIAATYILQGYLDRIYKA